MAPAKKAKSAKPAAKAKANKPAKKKAALPAAAKGGGKSASSAALKKVADLAKSVAKTLRGSAAKPAPVSAVTKKSGKATVAAAALAPVPAKGALPSAHFPASSPVGGRRGGKKGGSLTSLRSTPVDPESVCREVACEGLATSAGYCRLHYIKNWTKIKRKEVILREKKLNQYIEELVAKYPDKYLEAIRQDLASDKDFAKVIHDLDLDEAVDDFEAEGESMEAIVGDIKRDFEDEGEGF